MSSVSTDITALLDVLEQVEGAMAELYAWLARGLAVDPEAAGFFAEMARDELRHRDLVVFQRHLVMKSRGAFGAVRADVDSMKQVLEQVRAFQRETPEPTLQEALVFVLELEGSDAETQYRSAIADANPQMAKFITSLAKADEHHAEALHEFARKRGVILSAVAPLGSPG